MLVFAYQVGFLRKCSYFSTFCTSSYPSEAWRILFFGTDIFALKSLDCLNNFRINSRLVNNLEVVCPPEKRRAKDIKQHDGHSTVRQFAETHGLKVHDWPLDNQNPSFVSRFDLGVVISFGHFIPSWIINNLPCGAINFHPSLLPKWRGASPMVHSLLNGEKETGVSVIDISSKKFDAGSILLQKKVQIAKNTSYEELSDQLSELSSDMLGTVLQNFVEYKNLAITQDEENVTKAPKVSKELGYIKWNQFSCSYIQRLSCAIGQQFGLSTKWNNKVVKLRTLVETTKSLKDVPDTSEAGQPYFDSSRNILYIKCKDGWVGWQSLQMEYRQAITAKEFYNGYLVNKTMGETSGNIFHNLNK